MNHLSTIFDRIQNLSFEYPSSVNTSRLQGRLERFRKWWRTQGENISSISNTLRFGQFLLKNCILRAMFGFLVTFSAVFLILFHQHGIPIRISLWACLGIAGVSSIFFTVSNTFRCVVILSLPNFGTQQGRFVLLAVITSLIVGGPLTSFSINIGEFGKIVQCTSLSTLKQGESILKSYAESYEDVFQYLDYHVANIRYTKDLVEQKVKPIKDSLTQIGLELDDFVNRMTRTGLDCHVAMTEARLACVDAVVKAFNHCKDIVARGVNDICEISWIATDICEPSLNELVVCAPLRASKWLALEVKTGIENLEKALRIEYAVIKDFHQSLDQTMNSSILQETVQDWIEATVGNVVSAMTILKYLFLATVLWIPFKSYRFLQQVRVGITTSPTSFSLTFPEYDNRQRQNELWLQGMSLLAHFIFTLIIFGVDYACYWFQYAIQFMGDIGNVTIRNGYTFSLNITIGEALLMTPIVTFQNDYLNKISTSTNRSYTIASMPSDCFPNSVAPSGIGSMGIILSVYALIILLILNGNRMLKYRLQIVYFVIPDLKPCRSTAIITTSLP